MKHPFWRSDFFLYQLPAVFWAAFIFASSSIPSKDIPNFVLFHYDKLIHGGIFFLFSFFLYRALKHQRRFLLFATHPMIFTLLFAALYGASDETHQLFVPGRTMDFFDFAADTVGAGLLLIVVTIRTRMRNRQAAKA